MVSSCGEPSLSQGFFRGIARTAAVCAGILTALIDLRMRSSLPNKASLLAVLDHVALRSVCTLGHGSGERLRNGAHSASDMRSKIAALTEGRARTRCHH